MSYKLQLNAKWNSLQIATQRVAITLRMNSHDGMRVCALTEKQFAVATQTSNHANPARPSTATTVKSEASYKL
jgi:hypothetical protein